MKKTIAGLLLLAAHAASPDQPLVKADKHGNIKLTGQQVVTLVNNAYICGMIDGSAHVFRELGHPSQAGEVNALAAAAPCDQVRQLLKGAGAK